MMVFFLHDGFSSSHRNPNVWAFQPRLANKAAVCACVFAKGSWEWCIFWHVLVKGECALSLSWQKKKNDSFAACIWVSVLLDQNCLSACLLSLCSFLILLERQGITKRATAWMRRGLGVEESVRFLLECLECWSVENTNVDSIPQSRANDLTRH